MDKIEVAFASPSKQMIFSVTAAETNTVQQVINESGVLNEFPEINLLKMSVGVFGKLCKLDAKVKAGDRIEIYRPLVQNPMDARRNRAVKTR